MSEEKATELLQPKIKKYLEENKKWTMMSTVPENIKVVIHELITHAQKRVCLSTDNPATYFDAIALADLEAAAKRGVPVHIIIHGENPLNGPLATEWKRVKAVSQTFGILPPLPILQTLWREMLITDNNARIDCWDMVSFACFKLGVLSKPHRTGIYLFNHLEKISILQNLFCNYVHAYRHHKQKIIAAKTPALPRTSGHELS